MKKLRNLILLWNLFHDRKVVTLDTIKRRCKVSARTAYRYILDLSESYLPVYYDDDSHGYRLSSNSRPLPTHLSADEFILIRMATEMLSRQLKGPYAKIIANLIDKIEATGPTTLNDLWQEGKTQFWEVDDDQGLTAFTNSLMLQAAIVLNKDVAITRVNSENENWLLVKHPFLCFKDEWSVCSSEEKHTSHPIPLSEVKEVIMQPRVAS